MTQSDELKGSYSDDRNPFDAIMSLRVLRMPLRMHCIFTRSYAGHRSSVDVCGGNARSRGVRRIMAVCKVLLCSKAAEAASHPWVRPPWDRAPDMPDL